MMTPTIHMNGTSRNSLLDEIKDAKHALSVAIEKLCAMRPNARDYYPQGPEAFEKAQQEHQSRLNAVGAVVRAMIGIIITPRAKAPAQPEYRGRTSRKLTKMPITIEGTPAINSPTKRTTGPRRPLRYSAR